jgi:hypothetical protein
MVDINFGPINNLDILLSFAVLLDLDILLDHIMLAGMM